MKVTVFRIDERLIHGQIVTAWLQYADAKQILVIDDAAAKDQLRRSLLQMATPKEVKLSVLSVEEGKERLSSDETDDKTLLLVGSPAAANAVIDSINDLKTINVGNQNMKKGKTRILDNFWLFPEDLAAFEELQEKNITCEFRTVPNDHAQNVYDLIAKTNQ
ncbi:PTS system mannose/fructose/N-acetylgalactosamine-transporter subunit IIB [Isobaculum melis]|uniref:PTS system, galactosamine-specific IIB component n=1 Tax=Isobaculum melis TaxID=142588 RepID=A0A1H9T1I0_9LACT|nr:PTS sugar transporter subunit IIB [Isobaculum melis]SER91122.1 PTS system, galactosamine-specific IIB component [Isobaculum melis]